MTKILFIKITTISHKPVLKNYMVSSKEGVLCQPTCYRTVKLCVDDKHTATPNANVYILQFDVNCTNPSS